MTVQRFPLAQIAPNPFQTRLAEDPAQVARIAESIAQVGLLQIPVGRAAGGLIRGDTRIELAFGHTRLAAFKALAAERADGRIDRLAFDEMPVDIRELSDLEMFELAVRENLDRRDLTAIEEARAMATYRDRFHKTSAEIGVLFGLSDSAVRNKLRLLDLPAPIQDQIQSREINEGTARKLLVVAKVAPQELPALARKVTGSESSSAESIDDELRWIVERRGTPLPDASRGWWPTDWKGVVEPPAPAELRRLLGKGAPKVEQLVGIAEAFRSGTDAAGVVKLYGIGEDLAERIRCLVVPPACSACEFHSVVGGDHYCGIEACAAQKAAAWKRHELERVSKKLGIPIYDPAKDGKLRCPAQGVWSSTGGKKLEASWEKRLKAKDPSLRLALKEEATWEDPVGTGSKLVELILIGKAAEQQRTRARGDNRLGGSSSYAAQQQKQRAAERFLEREAAPVFGPALKGLDNIALLEALAVETLGTSNWKKDLPAQKAARCARLRELILFELLNRQFAGYRVLSRGPAATARHLRGVAKTLGVRLPADWLKRAEPFRARGAGAQGQGRFHGNGRER